MSRRILAITLLAWALTACSATPEEPRGWLLTSDSSAVFMQWTNGGGQLAGSFSATDSFLCSTDTTDTGFTGVTDGSNVTITLAKGAGGFQNLQGQVSGDVLTIFASPVEAGSAIFHSASADDYRAAVTKLKEQITQSTACAIASTAPTPVVTAAATDLLKLSGQITDQVGKINVDDPAIVRAIDALRSDHGINLRVLLADSMGGVDPGTYAQNVGDVNLLGPNDGLLVITFADHKFGLWVGPGIKNVTKTEIDVILNGVVAQHLHAGDTAGAIVAAADALGTAGGSR